MDLSIFDFGPVHCQFKGCQGQSARIGPADLAMYWYQILPLDSGPQHGEGAYKFNTCAITVVLQIMLYLFPISFWFRTLFHYNNKNNDNIIIIIINTIIHTSSKKSTTSEYEHYFCDWIYGQYLFVLISSILLSLLIIASKLTSENADDTVDDIILSHYLDDLFDK